MINFFALKGSKLFVLIRCEALNSWLKLDDSFWLDPLWFNKRFSLALARSVGI